MFKRYIILFCTKRNIVKLLMGSPLDEELERHCNKNNGMIPYASRFNLAYPGFHPTLHMLAKGLAYLGLEYVMNLSIIASSIINTMIKGST